jgi:succinoglycan biosynthesis transport protein ExoP
MITSAPENSGSRNAGGLRSFPPSRPGGGSSDGPRHALYIFFSSVRRHLPVFLIVSSVLIGCGAFVFRDKAKPVYSSQSVVYISPKFPKVLNTDSEVELPYDSYFEDQIQTVTRYDIVSDAISHLPPAVRHRTDAPLPSEIAKLQHSLDVKRVGTSYEMSIGLLGSSPDGLADTVNAVTNSYVEITRNEEFYGLGDRLNTLRQESGHLREQIDSDLAEQADLMQQLGVASVSTGDGATNPYDTSSNSVRNQLNLARMQREAAEAQLDTSLKSDGVGEASALDTAAEEAITADPALSGMWSTLNTRRGLLLEEMSGLRPEHPIHQKDQDELSSIDGVMGDLRHKATAQLQSKLRRDVERTRLVELKLTQELNENTQNAAAAAPKYQRAIELGPEIETLQKAYEAIDDRIRDLELESSSPGSVHVSTRALTPSSPEHGRLPLYALALVLISLGCGSAVAIGIDLFDSRIYMPEDIERVVGFHPIGILLDSDEFSEGASEDYYFRLAAGINKAVRNAGARTFLFTSQAHGAGTSTIIRRLSEQLRGLNVRCRTITAAGSDGIDSSRGSFSRSELLLQGWNENDEIQQAPLAKGAVHSRPGSRTEEDAPPANSAEQALRQECVGYDVVLIDSDPLPISANTEYLARVVDATVLVIRAGMTTKQELHRAARLLERLEVPGVAVVLNKIRLERADRDLRRELHSFERPRSNYLSVIPKTAMTPKVAVQRSETSA